MRQAGAAPRSAVMRGQLSSSAVRVGIHQRSHRVAVAEQEVRALPLARERGARGGGLGGALAAAGRQQQEGQREEGAVSHPHDLAMMNGSAGSPLD